MNDYKKELNMLYTIKKEGGISAAARKMYLSQPALSQRLTTLELEVGFKIFRRDLSPVDFTYEGQLYLKKLEQIQELDRNFETQISEIQNQNFGMVSLALSSMRTQQLLPNLLLLMKERLPNLELKLVHGNKRSDLTELLADRKVDFIINSITYPEFMQEKLSQSDIVAVLPQSHPLSVACSHVKHWDSKEPISLHELKDDLFILNYPTQGSRIVAEQAFQMQNFAPQHILEVFDNYTITQLVQHGIGVALLASTTLAPLYDQLDVCLFRLTQSPVTNVYLSYRKSLYISSLMKQFIELCKTPTLWEIPKS